MDLETGEVQMSVCDRETGEMPASPRLNSETGEPEMNFTQPTARRSFRIPQGYIRQPCEQPDHQQCHLPADDFRNTRMSSVILFLLPTVIFAPVVAIFLGVLEISLHIWAHKKNKSLRGSDIFYQSPLHVIVSEFCACCIDENSKKKITKMQDKTNNKLTKYHYGFRIVT